MTFAFRPLPPRKRMTPAKPDMRPRHHRIVIDLKQLKATGRSQELVDLVKEILPEAPDPPAKRLGEANARWVLNQIAARVECPQDFNAVWHADRIVITFTQKPRIGEKLKAACKLP